ncbi:MAG: ABC transporter ATP-binding protein [Lachnospiraceae bacterium]|nr:ABC transporter ATP-binding protein [Lachnospiraceae bacterium]
MIEFSGISKRLGKFELKDLSFQIAEGEICGLVGRNGAGKTTLLNLLLGLIRPDEGTITIDGMEYREEEKKIRALLGCVLVDELFLPGAGLSENASYFGSTYDAFELSRFEGLLQEFRLDPAKKFRALSKGEKLKCQFAFALAVKPKYLLLDEPTANFDPDFRDHFWEHMKRFTAGGGSVLLATHLTDDLDRMADSLIFLDKGKSIFTGDMESFRDTYRIVSGEKYLVKMIDEQYRIGMEEAKYSTRALIAHHRRIRYPEGLELSPVSIEEFMYLYSKGGEKK